MQEPAQSAKASVSCNCQRNMQLPAQHAKAIVSCKSQRSMQVQIEMQEHASESLLLVHFHKLWS